MIRRNPHETRGRRQAPSFAAIGLLLAPLLACEVSTPPPPARIAGAQFITFRCAPRPDLPSSAFPELKRSGAPLDACGCTYVVGEGLLGFLDGPSCAVGNAEVRAYVAGNSFGEVAAVRLNRGPFTGEARILDSDGTIPGVTGVYVDDLVSGVEADPTGRFVLAVNSTSGTIAVIVDDFAIEPALVIDPGAGPLASIAVWPPIEQPMRSTDARLMLDGPRRAWITAPVSRRVIELDLEAVEALLDGQGTADALVTAVLDMPGEAVPAELAVHPAGDRLYVGHAARPAVTVFDLASGDPVADIDLSRRPVCEDPYLTEVIPVDQDQSCSDRLDNDGDGVIDAADPDCDGPWGSEWPNPACPQRAQCADGVDNDGQGLIDLADLDCQTGTGRWEGTPPQCANGIDDDGDGLIDRADAGCRDESDPDERPVGDGLERGDLCADELDNDDDGLIDGEDPGCQDPAFAAARYPEERPAACADGIDNDSDGLVDFAGGDPDCYAASDDSEGAGRIDLGPRHLRAVQLDVNGRTYDYLYATEAAGYLVAVDLSDPALRARFTGFDRPAQSIAVRQVGESTSILAVLSDSALHALLVTARAPLPTDDGLDVFARLEDAWYALDTPLELAGATWVAEVERLRHVGVRVPAFYTVVDGVAARIEAMDGVCPPAEAGAACPPGRSSNNGLCVPDACNADGDCAADLACVDGACVEPCATDGDCAAGEQCDRITPVDGSAERDICRSRCRIDEVGRLMVAPPADPCADGPCGEACRADADCGGGELACIDRVCAPWCTVSSCVAPFDARTAPPVEPGPTGGSALADPVVMRADRWRIVNDEPNIRLTAVGRTPRVITAPRLFVRTSQIRSAFERFPVFCTLPQPEETAAFPGWGDGECVPVGQALENARLRDLGDSELATQYRFRLDGYSGIQVVEEDAGALRTQDFSLIYEGVLPGSASISGQHAGPTTITLDPEVLRPEAVAEGRVTADGEVEGWTLIDYDQSFCNDGVEPGDVVLIDRMVPLQSEDEEETAAIKERCLAFTEADVDLPPDQRRDRLRYRVVEVGPYKLVLRPDGLTIDDTVDYADMISRDDRQPVPALAAPLPSPPVECMPELTTYRVRAGEAFILVGSATGYRHPWVRRGGQCVVDPQRVDRHSRVRLGVPFENEWFRFHLGRSPVLDETQRPFQVDVSLSFRLDAGREIRANADVVRMPQGMRWLPNNDLLYVVDGLIQTLVEIGGLDVLRTNFVVTNPSYD